MKFKTFNGNNSQNTKTDLLQKGNTVTYGVVKEIYRLNGRKRVAYGIAAYADAEEDGTLTILLSINDITTDRKALSRLIKMLNENRASLKHIRDIAEDFIS